jgi:hypothetical protein
VKCTSGALFVFAIAAAVAAGATEMSAQGLLGGGSANPKERQQLNVTLSSTEGYDSVTSPEISTAIGSGSPDSVGYSTMLVGAADYVFQGRRVQFRATDTSALGRQPGDVLNSYYKSISHTAGVSISARLASRTTLLFNQTAIYSPSSLYNLFARPAGTAPGDAPPAPPAPPDYAMSSSESHSYSTSMMLTRDISRRNSLSTTAEYQYTETSAQFDSRRELNSYGIRSRFSHRL